MAEIIESLVGEARKEEAAKRVNALSEMGVKVENLNWPDAPAEMFSIDARGLSEAFYGKHQNIANLGWTLEESKFNSVGQTLFLKALFPKGEFDLINEPRFAGQNGELLFREGPNGRGNMARIEEAKQAGKKVLGFVDKLGEGFLYAVTPEVVHS